VTEVAAGIPASGQSVHSWLARELAEGLAGLVDRSQRDAPMELWQLDIVGSCFLTDGRELKVGSH